MTHGQPRMMTIRQVAATGLLPFGRSGGHITFLPWLFV